MEHLNLECLARLVEHKPTADEARHLAECMVCASELQALKLQTEQLAALPEILPPLGDWEVLEARLRSEGLVKDGGLLGRMGLARTPGWMRAAAAVVLFLSGVGVGAGFTSTGGGEDPTRMPDLAFANAASVDEATRALRVAEQNYMAAFTRYSQLVGNEGSGDGPGVDPRSRFAALEYLLAASQAAVRQAPADPFLNGLLTATRAEREAVLRQISSGRDNWF